MKTIKELKNTLEEQIINSDHITIIPHLGVDFDAIGSAIGLSLIAKKLNKESCIIVDDPHYKIDSGVQIIINEAIEKGYNIINKEKYLQSKSQNNLFILTDVNKSYLISLQEEIYNKNILIIDHHATDNNTVKANNIYIDTSISSMCELTTKLLSLFKIKYDQDIANYLLAGIYLDTNRLTKNVTPETMIAVAKLLEYKADMNKVTELFVEDFISDRKIQELISKVNFFTYTIATVMGDNKLYTKEELAKAADYLLKYKVDAAFAIGFIEENLISISARSKGKINVGDIMQTLNGGGNEYSAATKIKDHDIKEVEKQLKKALTPTFYKK